ncbi:MAG: tryptophan synthase subunit alpha [Phycisphaerae bacterium]|nr:tryptophan synthase subunit alpha [Phycisphaerae bacterium]
MNRFVRRFSSQRDGAFIPFLVLGDPDLPASERLIRAAVDAGADALELGIPFSDPIADGPTIQRAATRARNAGADVDACLRLIERLRASADLPIGLLIYFNLAARQGLERFAQRLADCGVDAVVVADLPLEESAEFEQILAAQRVGIVQLVAPNTPLDRAAKLIDRSTAFTYVVSHFGTTGARARLDDATARRVSELRAITAKPLVVGFGVSSPAQAHGLANAGADGVIVGSALVARIEHHHGDPEAMDATVREFVRSFVSDRSPLSCSS